MADMTPTNAFAHAPASAAKTTFITAVDTLMTAIDTLATTAATGTSQVWALAITGTPTGGTFDITIVGDGDIEEQTVTFDFDDSAATIQTALRLLVGEGLDQTSVAQTGVAPNVTNTITFKGTREDITVTSPDAMTGGSSPTCTPTESTAFIPRPYFSTASKNMAKQGLVDWCESMASNMRA